MIKPRPFAESGMPTLATSPEGSHSEGPGEKILGEKKYFRNGVAILGDSPITLTTLCEPREAATRRGRHRWQVSAKQKIVNKLPSDFVFFILLFAFLSLTFCSLFWVSGNRFSVRSSRSGQSVGRVRRQTSAFASVLPPFARGPSPPTPPVSSWRDPGTRGWMTCGI